MPTEAANVAIRVPLYKEYQPSLTSYKTSDKPKTFITKMNETYDVVLESKLDPPKLYENMPSQFIITEFVEHEFNAKSFFLNSNNEIPSAVWNKAKNKLIDYALDNHDLLSMGDFRAEQLLYDTVKNKWRLADWAGKPYYSGTKYFTELLGITRYNLPTSSKELFQEIFFEILRKRYPTLYDGRFKFIKNKLFPIKSRDQIVTALKEFKEKKGTHFFANGQKTKEAYNKIEKRIYDDFISEVMAKEIYLSVKDLEVILSSNLFSNLTNPDVLMPFSSIYSIEYLDNLNKNMRTAMSNTKFPNINQSRIDIPAKLKINDLSSCLKKINKTL